MYDCAHSLPSMTSSAGNGLHLALRNWKTIMATKEPFNDGFSREIETRRSERETNRSWHGIRRIMESSSEFVHPWEARESETRLPKADENNSIEWRYGFMSFAIFQCHFVIRESGRPETDSWPSRQLDKGEDFFCVNLPPLMRRVNSWIPLKWRQKSLNDKEASKWSRSTRGR